MSFQSLVTGEISLANIMENAVHDALFVVLRDVKRGLSDYPGDTRLLELKRDVLNHIVRSHERRCTHKPKAGEADEQHD